MATTELPPITLSGVKHDAKVAEPAGIGEAVRLVLTPLASLRLTVTLLSLSLFLVLAGTLAQIDYDVWQVVHSYFRTWIAWIEPRIFFPRGWEVLAGRAFPFPGGKLLGVLLAANLFAAHAVRFKVAAKGGRLVGGLVLIGLGCLLTYAVIASGANTAVGSHLSEQFTNTLWHLMRGALGAAGLGLAYMLALTRRRAWQSAAKWLWWFGAVAALLVVGLAAWLFLNPETRLDPSGLRILWQLAKAGGASIVLALGCWAVFAKRGGVVLLHGGIALLMLSELYTAQRAVEAQMRIGEGETATYAEDMRSSELAITDYSDPKLDRVTIVPKSLVAEAYEAGKPIDVPELPFTIRVDTFMPNSTLRRLQPGEAATSTAGEGPLWTLEERPLSTGVAKEQAFDVPGAYVELLSKKDNGSHGVFLLSPFMRNGEPVSEGDAAYGVALRFKRVLKPYTITLEKFKHDVYQGTQTAKNFESVVRFRVPDRNIDQTLSTSMNNPIRYEGDTLYQADWDRETERGTVLQVVTNAGWMIPYTACMVVLMGMLVHFGQMIVRFVMRREGEARLRAMQGGDDVDTVSPRLGWRRAEYWGPALVLLYCVGMVGSYALPRHERATEVKIYEFGKLPAADGGRTLPLDSVARNELQLISGKQSYEDVRFKRSQPAIRWFLDVISQAPGWKDHKVIKVDNIDVLQALGLKPRHGFRYSVGELLHDQTETDEGELRRQVRLVDAVPEDKRNLMQQKMLEANGRLQRIFALRWAFDVPDFGQSAEEMVQRKAMIEEMIGILNRDAPRCIPPQTADGPWQTLYGATYNLVRTAIISGKQPPKENAASRWVAMLDAYRSGQAGAFNSAVEDCQESAASAAATEAEHESKLAATGQGSGRKPAERLVLDRIEFESYFNQVSPFVQCMVLYIIAFVLSVLSWLGWSRGFNRAANWLLWFTFALHTFGLIGRIYISGRPPITNLYSTAVFIGWAGVLFGLLFEIIYKLGIGNLLAATLGFPTMLIAYYLQNDGDTMGVMQAVLDTNFWLATHVVCINMGYCASFLAGALGLFTILLGYATGMLNEEQRRQVTRMTYGAVCFAIFFSFIGTVLGGLWADDSWGRFWGWDPKENGALMIVIWNAIVLHARWGKMIAERGLAVLTVLGNIVVAWSYFGVNQMGVGLHAYGFTEGRTFWVALFMVSQLAIALAALLGPWLRARPETAS
jgi:ABC-type transport system involved in cytochrome c biogenesis permease subunit